MPPESVAPSPSPAPYENAPYENVALNEPQGAEPQHVLDEIRRWQAISPDMVLKHTTSGMVNEFAFMIELKDSFPLHSTVFEQTSSSMSHEARNEDGFSLAKLLSDPHMHPSFLQVLTKLKGMSKERRPTKEAIYKKYQEMYHKDKRSDEIDHEEATIAAAAMAPNEDSE